MTFPAETMTTTGGLTSFKASRMSTDTVLMPASAKTNWAKRHIDELSTRVDEYTSSKPVRITTKYYPGMPREQNWLRFKTPIPVELSLMTGDAIHNLRSALDILIFEMIGSRVAKPRKLQFPFKESEADFRTFVKECDLSAAGDKVINIINSLQPYTGHNHDISSLNLADIQDKHRLILTTASVAVIEGRELAKVTSTGSIGHQHPNAVFRLIASGDSMWTSLVSDRRTEIPPFVDHERIDPPTVEILFGSQTPFSNLPLVPKLRELHGRIDTICRDLAQAFNSP